jgi:anti-sigma B factor antagonist
MPINYVDSNAKFRLIKLSGRLDIAGTTEIEGKFVAFAATEKIRVIVDLTGVNFLSSIGIRAIISNAKAQQQRGGKMVLFIGENAAVARTLELTGIATLIPTFKDMSEAEQAATQ